MHCVEITEIYSPPFLSEISWKQRIHYRNQYLVDLTKYFFSESKFIVFPQCVNFTFWKFLEHSVLFLSVSVANSPFGKQVSKRSCSSKALMVLLSSATWLNKGSYWLKSLNLLLLFVSMGGPAFGCRARAKTGPVTLGTTSTIRILTGCLEKTRNVNVASSPGSKVVGRTEKRIIRFVSFGDTGQISAQCGKMKNLLSLKRKIRQINYLVIYLVKPLLWRNFCPKCVRVNYQKQCTVWKNNKFTVHSVVIS